MDKKKKTKIVVGISLVFISICLIILGIFLGGEKKEKAPGENNNNLEKYDKMLGVKLDELQRKVIDLSFEFNDYLVDPTKGNKDYSKLTKLPANHFLPMVGNEALQNIIFPKDYLKKVDKKEALKYADAQKKYNNNLEKMIKKDFEFKIKEVPLYTENENQLMVISEVKPFGYTKYRKDLNEISTELLALSGENIQEENEKTAFLFYKAKVKALEILDANLNEYKNDKWFIANLVFDLGDTIKCSNCDIYINDAQGMYLEDVKFENGQDTYMLNKDQRIKNILDKAIQEGILKKEKPLELK